MSNDSSTGGYVLATSSDPYDQALDRILQQAVAAITGIDPTMVRPRWQVNPPTMPEPEVNWAAVGVSLIDPDHNDYERHVVATDGQGNDVSYSQVERDEAMTVLTSFYGPAAMSNAMAWFDGLQVGQNREALKSNGIDLVEVRDAAQVPALLAMKWQRRVDVAATMSRRTDRSFPIRTLASGNGSLDNERYQTPIVIKP